MKTIVHKHRGHILDGKSSLQEVSASLSEVKVLAACQEELGPHSNCPDNIHTSGVAIQSSILLGVLPRSRDAS